MTTEAKAPADLPDRELIAEWESIECDSDNTSRSDALAAELQKRNLDF